MTLTRPPSACRVARRSANSQPDTGPDRETNPKNNIPTRQDELDELDIDLDQLLDMDDDEMRRHWLRVSLIAQLVRSMATATGVGGPVSGEPPEGRPSNHFDDHPSSSSSSVQSVGRRAIRRKTNLDVVINSHTSLATKTSRLTTRKRSSPLTTCPATGWKSSFATF